MSVLALAERLRLVVFDWDGTLADSSARIVGSFRRALETIDGPDVDDTTIRGTIGLELSDAAAVMMPHANAQQRDALTEAYRQHWLAPDAPRPKLFAGAVDCLDALRDRGWVLAVATGKSRRGLDREIGQTGIGDRFAASRTADETRGKPHPQMLHELLAELNTGPDCALMVGDTTFDLEMARAANVPAIAVGSGTHSDAQLSACSPVASIRSVSELAGCLGVV